MQRTNQVANIMVKLLSDNTVHKPEAVKDTQPRAVV